MPSDCFANESLDEQRLGLFGRNAARHQVEFELAVDRPGGCPMAALDVIGLLIASAVSDSRRARVIILPSVFWAWGCTVIRP
jgi:hypothetical protein